MTREQAVEQIRAIIREFRNVPHCCDADDHTPLDSNGEIIWDIDEEPRNIISEALEAEDVDGLYGCRLCRS